MEYEELTEKIIGCAMKVHRTLGPGFLESVYENALAIALAHAGLHVAQQPAIRVYFRGPQVGDFRCDLLVESKVILELKAGRDIAPEHIAQTLNYLKATDIEVALILNFGDKRIVQAPDIRQRKEEAADKHGLTKIEQNICAQPCSSVVNTF